MAYGLVQLTLDLVSGQGLNTGWVHCFVFLGEALQLDSASLKWVESNCQRNLTRVTRGYQQCTSIARLL